MYRALVILATVLTFAACDQGKEGPGGKSTSTPTSAAAPKGPTTGAAAANDDVDKEDIPVAEDFEEEAEKAVTDDNLDDEVAKMEKEINEDKDK
jgi:hypothetical protein